jgi:hypothetical protein
MTARSHHWWLPPCRPNTCIFNNGVLLFSSIFKGPKKQHGMVKGTWRIAMASFSFSVQLRRRSHGVLWVGLWGLTSTFCSFFDSFFLFASFLSDWRAKMAGRGLVITNTKMTCDCVFGGERRVHRWLWAGYALNQRGARCTRNITQNTKTQEYSQLYFIFEEQWCYLVVSDCACATSILAVVDCLASRLQISTLYHLLLAWAFYVLHHLLCNIDGEICTL